MKIRIGMMLALAVALCLSLALADAASMPAEVQRLLDQETADGFAVADYAEMPPEGWAFAVLQNTEGRNRLVIFCQQADGWSKWLETEKAVPQGVNMLELMVDHSGSPHNLYPESHPVLQPIFQVIQYNAPAGDPELAYAERRIEFALTDGKWMLTWWEDDRYSAVRIMAKEMLYYTNRTGNYHYQGGVAGTIQRDIRYFELQYMPKTLKAAEKSVTVAPVIPTGTLQPHEIQFTGGRNYEVYSGPGEQYLRGGNGKASVSTNDWIQVFGQESGWILIQYDIDKGHMRFGWIPESAMPSGASVPAFSFTYTFAYTAAPTFITDDPLNSRAQLATLAAGEPLTMLATMGDWIYVEKEGSAAEDGTVTAPVRGFVRSNALTWSVAYSVDRLGHVIPAHDYRTTPEDMQAWEQIVWALAGYDSVSAGQTTYFADDGTLLELQDTEVPWLNDVYTSDNTQWGGEEYTMDSGTYARLVSFLDQVNPGMSRSYHPGWMEWRIVIDGVQYAQYNLLPDTEDGEWLTFTVQESPEWKIQYFACISNG